MNIINSWYRSSVDPLKIGFILNQWLDSLIPEDIHDYDSPKDPSKVVQNGTNLGLNMHNTYLFASYTRSDRLYCRRLIIFLIYTGSSHGSIEGGRPQSDGLTKLVSMNIKTIVSLEREWFEKEPDAVKRERLFVVRNNIPFIHIPMHPFLRPERKDILKTLNVIVDPANRPVFVHCRKGSDRTGMVLAAFRIQYQGWTLEQAEMEMRCYGYRNIFLFWWRNALEESEMEVNKKPCVIQTNAVYQYTSVLVRV